MLSAPGKIGSIGQTVVKRSVTGPQLALASVVQLTEGNAGTKTFSFTVICAGAGEGDVGVDWSVEPSTANPAAASDFEGGVFPSGSLLFGVEDVQKIIDVVVVGDTAWEPDEGFLVRLSNPVNATIVVSTASGTILNDDAAPTPAAVSDLSVVDATTTTVTLAFSAVTHATFYQYRLNGGSAATLAGDKVITGLTQNTAYDIEVQALNGTGGSAWSSVAEATTLAAVPTTISDLAAPSVGITTAGLAFTAATYAQSYEYRLDSGAPVALAENKTITGLTGGTDYSVEVRGVNEAERGAWSNAVLFETVAESDFSPLDLGADLYHYWTPSSGVTLVGSAATAVEDLGGAADLAQAAGSSQPTVLESGLPGGPAFNFDGTNDRLGSVSLPEVPDHHEIWTVVDQQALATDTANRQIIGAPGIGVRRVVVSGVNRLRAFINTAFAVTETLDSSIDFSGRFVIRIVVAPTGTEIYMNGVLVASSATDIQTVVTPDNTFWLGSSGTGTTWWKGLIGDTAITAILDSTQAGHMTSHYNALGGM